LRAKTGFINGTSALSGLVDTKNGRTLVFSILVQYPAQGGLNTSVWKPMQNEICRELARVGG
jgi:D-alanyl-D-alanine carboxypeptidase